MPAQHYELLRQIAADDHSVTYAARDSHRELRLQTYAAARNDPALFAKLKRRIRLVAMLRQPATLAILEHDLETETPFAAIESPPPQRLADLSPKTAFPDPQTLLQTAVEIAQAIAEAHRFGLRHGALAPAEIFWEESPKLDFLHRRSFTVSASAEEDAAALAELLAWMASDLIDDEDFDAIRSDWEQLLLDLQTDPPPIRDAAARLEALLAVWKGSAQTVQYQLEQTLAAEDQATQVFHPEKPAAPRQLGRFRLLEVLGEGGMGTVYRAEDSADGAIVAVKTLLAMQNAKEQARRRFLKEARLLAQVNNPYVTRLLEVDEDQDVLYLAMEFVAGESVAQRLKTQPQFAEEDALAIMMDVARALSEAHHLQIVHRDVKPANILLESDGGAKLADFGLARQVAQSQSMELTQGAVLGTPFYMAPEQCSGAGEVDPRTDVYAMGATLFHMLAGKPPFYHSDPIKLLGMHVNDAPPSLAKRLPELRPEADRIVQKALCKDPEDRYQNAGEMLDDLERLTRGEPTPLEIHPQSPQDAQGFWEYEFSWDLQSRPEELWPYVANTNRFNQGLGLPPVTYRTEVDPKRGVRRFAKTSLFGVRLAWEEHPFEWIEGKRFGTLREFSRGPYDWFITIVELTPAGNGGTQLTHRFRLRPRNLIGKLMIGMQMKWSIPGGLEKVYRRIDQTVFHQRVSSESQTDHPSDAFEPPPRLTSSTIKRLNQRLERLSKTAANPQCVEGLGRFLATAVDDEAARIRPLALAELLGVDGETFTNACLLAVQEGLLTLQWDVLCPVCRVAANVRDSLRAIEEHEHCEVCNLDFDADFSAAVELIFRVHPEIRQVVSKTYCIGGPANFPHIVAQIRMQPGERVELPLRLSPGAYRLGGPQLPNVWELSVSSSGEVARWEFSLGEAASPPTFREGRQTLLLNNPASREILVRLERSAIRKDTMTAARASTLAVFRDLFPQEALTSGRMAGVSGVTLVAASIGPLDRFYQTQGDGAAFAIVRRFLQLADAGVRSQGGAVVKTIADGILASFEDPLRAVRFAAAAAKMLAEEEPLRETSVRIAAHRGNAMITTLNGRLDYFGRTVNSVFQLLQHADENACWMTQAIAEDPAVAEWLAEQQQATAIVEKEIAGLEGVLLHRLDLNDRRSL